ncbi:hypothetical protein [Lacticaseibacillus paracasei]|uniref:hypothetical protein n=1 Tax=Lacticaseibacillus paracasei TaxID=1597 RepID=UPI002905679D|nr:hypothetical protein [Lacticaseibacillus paracasei]
MQTTQRPGLELMLLGDFETGFWARSAVSALATRRHPHLAGDCGVWHGKNRLSSAILNFLL